MRLVQSVQQHHLLTWDVDPTQVAANLPDGFEPALADGRGLVSLAAFRVRHCRLGGIPVPGFKQVTVRTYATDPDGGPAVFFFLFRSSPAGLEQLPFGVPVRFTVIRIADDRFSAPGLGLSCSFSPEQGPLELPSLDPPVGSHEVGYWRAGGLRRVTTRHRPVRWRAVVPERGARFDPLLALGFDVHQPRWCLTAESTDFEVDLPPVKIDRR